MAAGDLKISVRALRYERQRLSDLVLTPLQLIKDFIARNLSSRNVADVVALLNNVIRSDTLKTITDGDALIAVLDLYYGKDNLGVLKRLLNKVNRSDLLNVLDDWESSSNPLNTELFQECGYFPLWIKIKNHFTWFSENKKSIFKSIKTVFRIAEIDARDPDYDTLIFMGVSLGEADILVYVLVPICMRRYVRVSMEDREVVHVLEQLHITGVYFGRKSGREKQDDNYSVTSFSSLAESLQRGDVGHLTNGDNLQQNYSNKREYRSGREDSSLEGNYNTDLRKGPSQVASSSHSEGSESVRVIRTSMGYIDHAHTRIKYRNPEDHWDSAVNLRQSIHNVHPRVFEVEGISSRQSQQSKTEEFMDMRDEGLLNNEVQEARFGSLDNQMDSLDNGFYVVNQGIDSKVDRADVDHFQRSPVQAVNFHGKEEDYEEEDTFDRQTAVLDFAKKDTFDHAYENDMLMNHSPAETKEAGLENESKEVPLEEPTLIQFEKSSSEYIGNGRYASTVTLQVNRGKTSGSPKQVNKSTHSPKTMTDIKRGDNIIGDEDPLIKTQQDFVEGEVTLHYIQPFQRSQENGLSKWYEETPTDESYTVMKPEPEPGYASMEPEENACVMVPEEEIATPSHAVRILNNQVKTPIFSPPDEFRDRTPINSQLVKVRAVQVNEHKHHASLIRLHSDAFRDPHQAANLVWYNHSEPPISSYGNTSQPLDGVSETWDQGHTTYFQLENNRMGVAEENPRQSSILIKSDNEFYSDYEDSVFTESENQDFSSNKYPVVLPPYIPPPDYKASLKKSLVKSSEESTSTDTSDFVYKSHLLSAASISSIYKEKEMFLSREELQTSIRGAEDKEVEKQLELCKELLTAAKAGDEEEVKRIVDEGVDVNHQNEFGHSAVMVASREGHLDVVEILIRANADVDLQEGFGKSALHEAAWSGQHKVVHRLISAGANVNITDEDHRTPLHYAAMRGKRRIAEVLLLFGADVSVLTKNGASAVEMAYCYRHDDIVDLLMSSRDKKTRKEMEARIRKQKLRNLSSAASLPNLSKASSMKELSRSRSRPDLRKKKSVCVLQ